MPTKNKKELIFQQQKINLTYFSYFLKKSIDKRQKSLYIGTSQLINECVAQLVEHLTFNQRAQGSNPCTLTIYKKTPLAGGFFINV